MRLRFAAIGQNLKSCREKNIKGIMTLAIARVIIYLHEGIPTAGFI